CDVRGTTMVLFVARLAALLLTMTAGRIFWISPPIDGSKSIQYTSPRLKSISDQCLAPCLCFCFPLRIGRHFAITLIEFVVLLLLEGLRGADHGTCYLVWHDEPSCISARLGLPAPGLIHVTVPTNSDGRLLVPLELCDRPAKFSRPFIVDDLNVFNQTARRLRRI